MKTTGFVKNAAILTVTSLMLRTIGMVFRIYMAGKIGAEGMGLYQLIISIYTLAATFASAGICTAVTRLVTDELACGRPSSVGRVMRRAIALSVIIGVLSGILLYLSADLIAGRWLKDTRATLSIRVLGFSLPFMGVSSCLRGYFVARRRVIIPSTAQLLEQGVRIGVIMTLMDRLLPLGVGFGCMAILLGDGVAEATSCLFQSVGYAFDRRKIKRKADVPVPLIKRLAGIALPITAGRYLNTALRTIENVLVPAKLAAYCLSKEKALASFGALKGMAMPLIFFPASFLNALSTLLIPEVSEAAALHQSLRVNRAVGRTLHLTLTASIGLSGLFTLFAGELGQLFYQSDEVGFLLRVLAPLMPVMYLESIVDGILKGLNQQVSSLKHSVADSALRILLIWLIVPHRGMEGFLFIMVLSNLFTSGLNLHRLLTVTGMKMNWGRWVIKPLLGAATAGGLGVLVTRLPLLSGGSTLLVTAVGGIITVGLYALLLPMLGCLTREDLRVRG